MDFISLTVAIASFAVSVWALWLTLAVSGLAWLPAYLLIGRKTIEEVVERAFFSNSESPYYDKENNIFDRRYYAIRYWNEEYFKEPALRCHLRAIFARLFLKYDCYVKGTPNPFLKHIKLEDIQYYRMPGWGK